MHHPPPTPAFPLLQTLAAAVGQRVSWSVDPDGIATLHVGRHELLILTTLEDAVAAALDQHAKRWGRIGVWLQSAEQVLEPLAPRLPALTRALSAARDLGLDAIAASVQRIVQAEEAIGSVCREASRHVPTSIELAAALRRFAEAVATDMDTNLIMVFDRQKGGRGGEFTVVVSHPRGPFYVEDFHLPDALRRLGAKLQKELGRLPAVAEALTELKTLDDLGTTGSIDA